jgi:hypothetical protein
MLAWACSHWFGSDPSVLFGHGWACLGSPCCGPFAKLFGIARTCSCFCFRAWRGGLMADGSEILALQAILKRETFSN